MEPGGQRGMHQVLRRATRRDEKVVVVGIDRRAAACEIGRKGDRPLGNLKAPALRVVAQRGQGSLAHHVMQWRSGRAQGLHYRRSQGAGSALPSSPDEQTVNAGMAVTPAAARSSRRLDWTTGIADETLN